MHADVTILGGGPVGATLALLLARAAARPERIVLCRPRRPAVASASAATDPRSMALNHGSRVLLASLDAWPDGGADILHVHVSQKGRLGRTHISHSDFGVPALGTVVPYPAIVEALDAALALSGITVRAGEPAAILRQEGDAAVIGQEGQEWATRACVHAEGGTFDHQARNDLHRDYGQHAVLAIVRASRPRPGWAWERFTTEGPLALLPYPAGPAHNAGRYALVWCCRPGHAERLAALDDGAFAEALGQTFGTRLGSFAAAGPRHRYPLGINLRRHVVDGNAVAIGNAAQTLHPVAGQGMNLGLRDAARLAESLAPLLRDPSAGAAPLLAAYARARGADRWLTSGLTDFMPRIFTTGLAPVEHACGLALLGLDVSRTLRGPLARQLMEGLRA
ncbi:UbiH/UbiF/VisC/COQ6 family ubiquinone biosynthesis hydroxylase [Pigmentiphaga sp. H8]|uniref:UbiH/UbiF/VisC/COQ6 family ubiquinone biosynthesis hydroxylase n=1 Tax=Pigmentiphaga sp. H8 TaxID=2488560 RepID=UPI000F5A8066|nr:UbiH/UbiF/VisC/COQ6 family ubiquinone biosynthesis hydroxylase [Pigmentiphaga sp. H8]AZG10063.1 UbiH/UbiF/VisC/COQ6 family ubiquinone biosynthesis hydroxylase [Pigmentiphaga sp. H8]